MQDTGIPEKKILRLLHNPFHLLGMKQSCRVLGGSSTRKYQSVGMDAQAQAVCTEYNAFVVRADDLSIFGVST